MSQILLLTNNPLNEYPIEKRIRQLGHEVFTSRELIELFQSKMVLSEFVQIFHSIILSETISNEEVKEIAKNMSTYSIPILRKSDKKNDEIESEEWSELGITDSLECRPSIEILREKLSFNKSENNSFSMYGNEKLPLASLSLSNSEIRLLGILYNQDQRIISRDELSQKMWNREKSNSSMSQLSVMVKNLKAKFKSQNITGPIIETCWGQGYRLHELVYEQVDLSTKENVYNSL
ncbi:MAG: helix-turn-helix domain-containing protein [Enterococcus sp.]